MENIHTVLVVRHGELVFERYFTGDDELFGRPLGQVAYDRTKLHDMCSISKTVTSLSILRLIPEPPGHIRPGSLIELEGRHLLTLAPKDLRAVRGNEIAMVFQEPMTSLNPVFTIGDQIAEVAIVHQQLSRKAARARDDVPRLPIEAAEARE